MLSLDKQRNQFGRTVADNDVFHLTVCIIGDTAAQLCILTVGIARDSIQLIGERVLQMIGDSERIDIGTEAYDILSFIW